MALFKVLALACIFSTCVNNDPKYYTASKSFVQNFNARMKDQYQLSFLGWGGVFDSGINGLYIDYEVCMDPSEKISSDLLEMVMNDLVRAMNREVNLKGHLNQYPVTNENISVSIAFVDEKKRAVKPLSQIDFHDQKICFSSFDQNTQQYKTYKEVKKIN